MKLIILTMMLAHDAFYLNMHALLIVTIASEYDLDLCGDLFKGRVMSKTVAAAGMKHKGIFIHAH